MLFMETNLNFKKSKKNSKISSLYLIVLFSLINFIRNHTCGFDNYPHKKPEVLDMGNSENDNLRFLQTTSFQQIRIYFDYTTLDTQIDKVDINQINGIKQILSNTQTIIENIISLKRYGTKLKVKSCDTTVTIADVVKTGIDADLVIFPFFDMSIANTSTEAYATACIISSVDNRPVAGLIGFSPKFNTAKPNWLTYYTNLALHELSHVIVFNPNLFEYFKDPSGVLYTQDKIYKSTIVNGMPRSLLILPKVVAAAKKHFNCTTLEGIELENQGGVGTAGSHWETRIMLGDYMVGLSFDDTAISEITLALFEDSGWYQVNYYTGGLFKYGKNKGCNFLNKKCIENSTPLSLDEYCGTPYQSLCVTNKLSRGICYITDSANPTDNNYRYFPKTNTGGLFMADYCPIIAVPTNSTYYYPWSCNTGYSLYPVDYDESITEISGCFMSTLVKSSASSKYSTTSYRATCYKFSCDFASSILKVTVGYDSANCPKEGGLIKLNNYVGNIVCPDFYSLCTSETVCRDIVSCALKKALPVLQVFSYTPTGTLATVINTSNNVNTSTISSPPPSSIPTSSTITTNQPTVTGTTSTSSSPNSPVIIPATPIVVVGNTNVNATVDITANKPPVYNKPLVSDSSTNEQKYLFLSYLLGIFFILNILI